MKKIWYKSTAGVRTRRVRDMTDTNAMHSYQFSRFRVRSSIKIPEMTNVEGSYSSDDADIVITDDDLLNNSSVPDTGVEVFHTDRTLLLAYAGVGVFRIEHGSRVEIEPLSGVTERTLRRYIVGPVLGILLAQRGYLVQHASTIEMAQGAVSFIGAEGQGKSTLAAMGLVKGHSLVCDDVTAIEIEKDGVNILPGLPLIKLDSAVMESIDGSFDRYPPVSGGKTHYDVSSNIVTASSRLKRIYLLDRGKSIKFEPLSPSEALTTMVGNTYTKPLLEDETNLAANFQQCSTTADLVPVTRLTRPKKFTSVSKVIDRIELDLQLNQRL